MALFKDLVRAIAEIEGLDEMTVIGIGQYARDGGFISKSGRGRAGAQMTARDAVNLLIAVNAASKAKDAAVVIPIYRELEAFDDIPQASETYLRDAMDPKDPLDRALRRGSSFGSAMEILINICTPGAEDSVAEEHLPELTISFYRPSPSVVIDVGDYSDPNDPEQYYHTTFRSVASATASIPDRRDVTTISSRTLQAVGRVLAT